MKIYKKQCVFELFYLRCTINSQTEQEKLKS